MSKFFNALAVAVLGFALLMGAASAGNTATLSGDVKSSYEITVASGETALSFGTLLLGDNTKTTTGDFLNLTSNYQPLTLQATGNNNGHMVQGTNTLDNQLKVGLGAGFEPFTPVAISNTATAVANQKDTTGPSIYPGTFIQKVGYQDAKADGYSIIVTFSAA